mmetsp:Transcript_6290/g.19837  ORF Transcript_6290/g.19837 Transcript_6290/m.19837 type:complete len:322 (+) Transcript_6290:282-1247(+)
MIRHRRYTDETRRAAPADGRVQQPPLRRDVREALVERRAELAARARVRFDFDVARVGMPLANRRLDVSHLRLDRSHHVLGVEREQRRQLARERLLGRTLEARRVLVQQLRRDPRAVKVDLALVRERVGPHALRLDRVDVVDGRPSSQRALDVDQHGVLDGGADQVAPVERRQHAADGAQQHAHRDARARVVERVLVRQGEAHAAAHHEYARAGRRVLAQDREQRRVFQARQVSVERHGRWLVLERVAHGSVQHGAVDPQRHAQDAPGLPAPQPREVRRRRRAEQLRDRRVQGDARAEPKRAQRAHQRPEVHALAVAVGVLF